MKKNILLIIVCLVLIVNANCQITKGNWLVGGSGSFSSQKDKFDNGNTYTNNAMTILPNVGYFFIDKFAGGLKANITLTKFKDEFNGNTIRSRQNRFGIGPFLRYYFLDTENKINLFSQASYQWLLTTGSNNGIAIPKSTLYFYTFTAGPVIYFNSSVGMEVTLNYEHYQRESTQYTNKYYIAIGFQIHLEKN